MNTSAMACAEHGVLVEDEWRPERDRVQARVIADSLSPTGHRLTTLEVTMHRFMLAEFNTHRVFSRNSESSRAVPLRKRLHKVRWSPAIPLVFPAEQKGMSGGEPLDHDDYFRAVDAWTEAASKAADMAEELTREDRYAAPVHKSVVNRLLEPFLWHTVVVTATEWEGFFHQRCHEAAQPEIQAAAECMRAVMEMSTPADVAYGQWHLPFIETDDLHAIARLLASRAGATGEDVITLAKQVSSARCARTSYVTHDGRRSIEDDLGLYERLVVRQALDTDPVHWSPLEHVATPRPHAACPGNFRGWLQHRHELDTDPYAAEAS